MFFKLRVQVEWVIEDTVWAIPYYISKGIFFVEQIDQFPQNKSVFFFIITKKSKMGTHILLMIV